MKTKTKTGIAAMVMAALLLALSFRPAGPCIISGTITEKVTKDGIPSAAVLLFQNSKQIGGTTSDFDGNFCFTGIADGSYDITVNYVGYNTAKAKGIMVKEGKCNPLKIEMETSSKELETVEIISYKMPLLERSACMSVSTISKHSIKNMTGKLHTAATFIAS